MSKHQKTALSVNLNKVALLRNQRNLAWPNVSDIARRVIEAGAQGVTVHPRPDARHIRHDDVFEVADLVRGAFPDAEYNIEGYPSEAFLSLVTQAKPDQVTFVPDAPDQSTSDHGWDIHQYRTQLFSAVGKMKRVGIRVVLFVDEDPIAPLLAKEIGADRVEIYTGPYGASYPGEKAHYHLERMVITAQAAIQAGLGVNAGHDLTLSNLTDFITAMPEVDEVSIGHAITADALIMGFDAAVKAYLNVLGRSI